MTWEAFHHRGDVLNTVIAELATQREATLPLELPGVRATFRDELDLLAALHLRWHTRLSGRIERELAAQPLDLEQAVIAAWRATDASLPGVREVLDHYTEQPLDPEMAQALGKAAAKQRHMLAVMAGLVSTLEVDAQSARLGARIEDAARAGRSRPPVQPKPSLGFLDRLKAALAA